MQKPAAELLVEAGAELVMLVAERSAPPQRRDARHVGVVGGGAVHELGANIIELPVCPEGASPKIDSFSSI